MKKRVLSFLISLTMVMSIFSGMAVTVSAADGSDTYAVTESGMIADLTKDENITFTMKEEMIQLDVNNMDVGDIYVMSVTSLSLIEQIYMTAEEYIAVTQLGMGSPIVDATALDLDEDKDVIRDALTEGYTLMVSNEEMKPLVAAEMSEDSVVVVYKLNSNNMKMKAYDSAEDNPYTLEEATEAYVYAVQGIYSGVVEYKPAVSDNVQGSDGEAACPINDYVDASATKWYHDGVHYCLENGLMAGITDSLFAPNDTTTRGQLVTILWCLEGKPMVEIAEGFNDVNETDWYNNAVCWATANGIANGYGEGYFGPSDTVTREQMVSILWRYAQYKGLDVSVGENTNILSYDDAFDISGYAIPAMQWACGAGVVNGMEDPEGNMFLDPQGGATRAQTATMMMHFCKDIVK
ncbi:MAG: S-layer homology domain-containing protein [Anaerotignum sp.]|nr:S-layer homology domain-containing protein [Anaerotignum sp.]